jgi:branched-chain amino acid transport system permease protein
MSVLSKDVGAAASGAANRAAAASGVGRQLAGIAVFAILVAGLPLVTASGTTLNFATMALYAALIAQAWNILGGFGGQFSFGHALFFGSGAYIQAIAQLQGGINAWLALALAIAGAALVGLAIGALTFRYGLKGSYFALVTLAFAEVFRILALSVPFTGGGVGLMLPLREAPSNLQFASRSGYLWLMLGFVVAALLVTCWLRNGRFGAWLQALRDDEDAARAVGVDPLRVKLGAIGLSAAFMGAAGAFYVQLFQYIDPGIAYGSAISVEALVGAVVGGVGTLWGPVLGALVLHLLAELTRNLFGELPGINMVIYGTVLVLIVIFLPRGIAGFGLSVRRLWRGQQQGGGRG